MMYWAVPVFFMITGMLFLNPDKTITLKQCVKKYSYRVLLALFVFGVPFAVLKIMIETHSSSFLNIILAFKAVIENNSFGHLWYLYTLLGIYLILPFLKKIIDNSKDLEIKFLLIFLFIIDFYFPLLSELLCINIAFELPFKYPLFYVLSGYYFNKNKQWFANKRKLIASFIIVCILLVWGLNYMDAAPDTWTSYTSPLTAFLSVLIFIFFLTGRFPVSEKVWKADRLCFGVYLIHPLFIQFVYRYIKLTPANFNMYPLFTILFFVFFTFCAFAASWLMGKIKLFRKYIL